MLDGLEDEVAVLATEFDAPETVRQKYKTVLVEDSPWVWGSKLLQRFGLAHDVRVTRRAVETLRAAINDSSVSVALVHYLTTGVRYAEVWERIGKPVFIHCHGYDVTWDLRAADRPDRRVHADDYCDRVIALPPHVGFISNSNRTRARLLEIGIAADRIHLKYLGVPVDATPPERDYSNPEPTILFLGRLVDFKGPVEVIRAFTLASARGLRGRLIVAGDGPLMAACQAARTESEFRDRIELPGAVDEPTGVRLRAEADIFTAHNQFGPVSRQEEAFGVSVVEAMAAGIPVVTGESGSIPEIVTDGAQGRLVEPGDVEAHARAFEELAINPELRASMGRSGWQRVRDQFSSEREARRLAEILGV